MKRRSQWRNFLSVALVAATIGLALAPATRSVAAAGAAPINSGQGLNVLPLVNAQVGISPSPVTVVAAHRFFAKGSGFQAGETVNFTVTFPLYDGAFFPEPKTAIVGSDGTTPGILMSVPNGAKTGLPALTARGATSGRKATARIRVAYRPSIWVSSSNVHPGQSPTIAGSGFVPNSQERISVIVPRVAAPTLTLSQDVRADQYGNFSMAIAIPASIHAGVYTVTSVDLQRGFQALTKLTLTVHPTITLSPSPVIPGHTLNITGAGFAAFSQITLQAAIPLYRGGSKLIATTAQTDGSGNFLAQLRIPSNAASSSIRVNASALNAVASSHVLIQRLNARISVSPTSVIPGNTVTVQGAGFLAADPITITVRVTLTIGATRTVSTTATSDNQGQFRATLRLPTDAAGGTFTVTATSQSSGRAPTAQLSVARLAPSIVALPTTAVPGTQVAVHGFGFAAGERLSIFLDSQKLGSATTDSTGQFITNVTIPMTTAAGSFGLVVSAGNGQKANINLTVERHVSTHFYFPSEYTGSGYSNYLTFSNLTQIRARVTITYLLKSGTTQTKAVTTNPHTRYTEDVNADLGPGVSASAVVAADVPIVAEAVLYKGTDGAVTPGSASPSTIWYFANGNSSHGYREYIAVENPNPGPVQIAVRFLPTHHQAFTIFRNMPPTSRTTIKVASYVKDAVGLIITSNGPVVANRSIFVKHGVTSKNGVTSPERTWYFASGPLDNSAKNWIAAINPSGQGVYLTLQAYGPFGNILGTQSSFLQPYARAGYLVNKIAHQADAAVVLTSSAPVVAEQTTYVGSMHDASTDIFGVPIPAKSWSFAVVNTSTTRGETDGLDLFNPNSVPVPIVVQFINTAGGVVERKYVVNPLYHQHIDVGSVEPNAQLAIVAASNYPFVPMNRYGFSNGLGADTSTGSHG